MRFAKWIFIAAVFLSLGASLPRRAAPVGRPAKVERTPAAAPVVVSRSHAAKPRHRRHRRAVPRVVASPAPRPTPTAAPVLFVACDANIRARAATTTCPFAENVFYEYYLATAGYATGATVRAWSPAAGRFYDVPCRRRSAIVCSAGDGAEVRFSAASVAAYDDSQASAFAAAHATAGVPDVTPPAADPDPYPADNSGDDDGDPDGTGDEIPYYDQGTGYRVQCSDGMYSHSGGRPGACSGHGGVG